MPTVLQNITSSPSYMVNHSDYLPRCLLDFTADGLVNGGQDLEDIFVDLISNRKMFVFLVN